MSPIANHVLTQFQGNSVTFTADSAIVNPIWPGTPWASEDLPVPEREDRAVPALRQQFDRSIELSGKTVNLAVSRRMCGRVNLKVQPRGEPIDRGADFAACPSPPA